MTAPSVTHAVVVMGVSGCGKSTLARALSEALGWRFIEGDTLHPEANIAKMSAGIALDDRDRQPFLGRVARAIAAGRADGVIVTCSALKRRYRDLIRSLAGDVTFVLPVLSRERLLARLTRRSDHFMPASLLDSQLADLEAPQRDEHAILLDGTAATHEQVAHVLGALGLGGNQSV
jgi:gluconokinase